MAGGGVKIYIVCEPNSDGGDDIKELFVKREAAEKFVADNQYLTICEWDTADEL